MQIVIFPLFALTILVSVVFLKLSVGVPVRTLILGGVLVLIIAFYKRHFQYFINRHAIIIVLFLFMSALGFSLAIVQREPIVDTSLQLLRQIFQPLMMLICTYVMCYIAGVRATCYLLLAVTAFVSVFAVAQMIGIDFAWQLRMIIGSIQGDPPITAAFIRNKARAMGLAFSPIELSYLIACVYMLILLMQRARLVTDRVYWILLAGIMIAAVTIETRSLLLGIVLSETIRILTRGRLKTYLLLMFAVVAGVGVFLAMPEMDSRLVSVEDQSAAGRKVLYSFGLRLFFDNIMGLGWGFSAQDHAWLYWEHLTEFGKPQIIFRLDLHNAFLNYIIVYGILGIVPIIYFTIVYPRQAFQFYIIFVCYFVHSFFHNKGIFLAGYYVWYVIAVYLYLKDHSFMDSARSTSRPVLGRERHRSGKLGSGGIALPSPAQ